MNNPNKNGDVSISYLNVIVGIFLLILAVSGTFIGETMNCQLQKFLMYNMIAKNVVILMITYFALGFASNANKQDPVSTFKQSIAIWVFFLCFNKMDIEYASIVMFLLFIILICKDYITYYSNNDKNKHIDKINKLDNTIKHLFMIITGITLVGVVIYFKRQRSEYSRSFSYIKFIFGSSKCASHSTIH